MTREPGPYTVTLAAGPYAGQVAHAWRCLDPECLMESRLLTDEQIADALGLDELERALAAGAAASAASAGWITHQAAHLEWGARR